MKTNFYDIESLKNVFTLCLFEKEENNIKIFYLIDDDHINPTKLYTAKNGKNYEEDFIKPLTQEILSANRNFNGTIEVFDLNDTDVLKTQKNNILFATIFGLSNAQMVNNPDSPSEYLSLTRPVCDTDENYDENIHPYLMGYNSFNYDTTMLTLYLYETFTKKSLNKQGKEKAYITPPTAALMRQYNDDLFTDQFIDSMPSYLAKEKKAHRNHWSQPDYTQDRWRIRKNMLLSGRHIDVAKLNETKSKVALKRLLGMLGYQILESSKLRSDQANIDTIEQLYDLIAYNVSDVVNLDRLFCDKLYRGRFELKKELLASYPELIYQQKRNSYEPDISPRTVRRDRMTIDSTSAKLATYTLCPYGHLKDIEKVSFMYPSEKKAKELGIPRRNILEEAKTFFYDRFRNEEIRAKFEEVYLFYKSIEGNNYNSSKYYTEDYGIDVYSDISGHSIERLADTPKRQTTIPYFAKETDEKGNVSEYATSCFVTFSTGGIHGAEYNKALYEKDMNAYLKEKELFEEVKLIFPDPLDLKKSKTVTDSSGEVHKSTRFLKAGSTLKESFYKEITEPVLFKIKDDGSNELNARYVFTSAARTNHEDFKSYYPNMLINMGAFENPGLGYDRYQEIYIQKEDYGRLMKDLSIPATERGLYTIKREGTKLILNSASGAADTLYESPIALNNYIISMRIIGQLFSWMIGQEQTLHGARIISTNTDGLYSCLDPELNNRILAESGKNIGVDIEPEEMYLISKDSNNRAEMNQDADIIYGASGGSLACHNGPNPTKSLAHPAIIDWALLEYLRTFRDHLDMDFDKNVGRLILQHGKEMFDKPEVLRMFQNIIASSIGTMTYNFSEKINPDDLSDYENNIGILSHYNRILFVKDNAPGAVTVQAATARKVTPATMKKRTKDGEQLYQSDPKARYILMNNGVPLQNDRDETIKKISSVDADWPVIILNNDLHTMTDKELSAVIKQLDIEKYLLLLEAAYENNWKNLT